MTAFFQKVTASMVRLCRQAITAPGKLWEQDRNQLIASLEAAVRLNAAYQEQFQAVKVRWRLRKAGSPFAMQVTRTCRFACRLSTVTTHGPARLWLWLQHP